MLDSPPNTSGGGDAARLDWLERMANVRGGLRCTNGSESAASGSAFEPVH